MTKGKASYSMPTPKTSEMTAAPTAPPRRGCRVYERHECDLKTSCQPPSFLGGQEPHWSGEVRNISQDGLALVLRRRYEKGTGLAVELPGSDPQRPFTVFVRVIHVLAQPDGSWLLGCAFVSRLSEEEVRDLAEGPDTTAQEPDAGRGKRRRQDH